MSAQDLTRKRKHRNDGKACLIAEVNNFKEEIFGKTVKQSDADAAWMEIWTRVKAAGFKFGLKSEENRIETIKSALYTARLKTWQNAVFRKYEESKDTGDFAIAQWEVPLVWISQYQGHKFELDGFPEEEPKQKKHKLPASQESNENSSNQSVNESASQKLNEKKQDELIVAPKVVLPKTTQSAFDVEIGDKSTQEDATLDTPEEEGKKEKNSPIVTEEGNGMSQTKSPLSSILSTIVTNSQEDGNHKSSDQQVQKLHEVAAVTNSQEEGNRGNLDQPAHKIDHDKQPSLGLPSPGHTLNEFVDKVQGKKEEQKFDQQENNPHGLEFDPMNEAMHQPEGSILMEADLPTDEYDRKMFMDVLKAEALRMRYTQDALQSWKLANEANLPFQFILPGYGLFMNERAKEIRRNESSIGIQTQSTSNAENGVPVNILLSQSIIQFRKNEDEQLGNK